MGPVQYLNRIDPLVVWVSKLNHLSELKDEPLRRDCPDLSRAGEFQPSCELTLVTAAHEYLGKRGPGYEGPPS
jgi:hypothetical protein